MKKYTNSVIALFICMLILTPSTVYAEGAGIYACIFGYTANYRCCTAQ